MQEEERPRNEVPPQWQRPAILVGIRDTLPLALGIFAFGGATGTLAAQKGLTLAQAVGMSGLFYAGAAQVVTLQAWPEHLTILGIASLVGLATIVNLRFLLMGATLRPHLGALPPWRVYPLLPLMTDNNWLTALRYYDRHPPDLGYFLAAGLLNWLVFIAGTVPGWLFANTFTNPGRYGIDVIVPAFFAALLLPGWRGRRQTIAWGLAAIVALATWHFVPGAWYILAGGLVGAIAGGFVDERV